MSNAYYSVSGNPGTGSQGTSALIRTEFTSLQAAFDLLPVFTANGGKAVVVNGGGTALTITAGTLALAGNFSTTGAFNTVFAQGASITITLPVVSGTLATLAGTETLLSKTLVAPALGTPVSGVATNLTGTAAGLTVGNATAAVTATSATTATTATTATNLTGGSVAATTISASGAVSGAGFVARLSAPGAVGDVTPSTGAFTSIASTGLVTAVTPGTSGNQVVNFSQFAPTIANPGHYLLPGGVIVNFGNAVTNASGNVTVTFDKAFLTNGISVVATVASSGAVHLTSWASLTQTTVILYAYNTSGTGIPGLTIGYQVTGS